MEEKTKGLSPLQEVAQGQFSGETIGSLMEECAGLAQQIDSEKERMERFMLETGGASDASDRIQADIDSLQGMLEAAESRLQTLLDAQEQEFYSSEKSLDRKENTNERESVIQQLTGKKAEAEMKNHQEGKKEMKSPKRDMER